MNNNEKPPIEYFLFSPQQRKSEADMKHARSFLKAMRKELIIRINEEEK